MPPVSSPPPLALYVHLPWCVSKCPYCDFNSHALAGSLPAREYTDALLADLAFSLDGIRGVGDRQFIALFFGGGTPSLFPPAQIARVIDFLRDEQRLAPDAEISLEANPGTVEHGSFVDFADAGINRVSLGAQSFSQQKLTALGRIHGPEDTVRAVAELRAAGIENFNLDLMFALPGQQTDEMLSDIDQAVALEPAHISAYQLTVEPNTAFHRHPPVLPDHESSAEMQQLAAERLKDAGYAQYEVSAYAQTGRRCRHNLNYWQYGDYLGVGAGAHQKLTDSEGRIRRTHRRAHPGRYMKLAGSEECIAASREISLDERVFEFMLNALRLRGGFDRALFESRTGVALGEIESRLEGARIKGLLEQHGEDRWRASSLGWRFLNDLQAIFLPPGQAA
ncbi:MAG: radical SAM family heme chaperone HemW [Gammaproteobacteria bacterium]|nr:radical SAM family heme chaperone HemW [Gammaproteobacteria bacterium]